jgi:hypothetical protein
MSDVMQQCVPVATGALTPDQRVNYLFGLVLGVDEFQQEDLYLRERDERATRTLHGYGTSVGLDVTAERPAAAPDDVEVKVAPGVAADQRGRPVVLPAAQCARVGAWIAAEEEQAAAEEAASPLDEHRGPSGDVTLYVVVEHDVCPDGLVPLPGKPCGSDDEVTAPSRLRDSWRLGFRWVPPAMPHWDGVRALADLLVPIELDDLSPIESDEELLAEHIRALVPGTVPPATPLPPLPARPLLPRAEARAALDRLLTIWVTEVRPALAPDPIAPEGEAAILLSTITVVPAQPFATDAPEIVDFQPPDDEGRPYLAPSQLVQELVLLGGGTTLLGGSPIEAEALTELAMLTQIELVDSEVGDRPALLLWATIPDFLILPDTVDVLRDGNGPSSFRVHAHDLPNTFLLLPVEGRVGPGELIEVQLDLTRLQVEQTDETQVALTTWLEQEGLDVFGREGDRLRLRHVVADVPEEQPPEPPRPVRKLVSAQPVLVDDELPGIELWWHVDRSPGTDEERVLDLNSGMIRVVAEVEDAATPVELQFGMSRPRHNVDQLLLDRGVWEDAARRSPYLRVLISLEGLFLDPFGGNAMAYADDLGVVWEDAQEDGRMLVAWVRMPDRRDL